MQIEECFTAGSYFLNSSILGVWVAKYFSEVRFSRIIFNEATCNNTQRCLLFKTFSIDLTRLNSIFPIVAAAVRYTLKSINSCIRAWFQLSPPSAKKTPEWAYSYQYKILLVSLYIFSNRTFFVVLELLSACSSSYEKRHRDQCECAYHLWRMLVRWLVIKKLQIQERVRFMKYKLFLLGFLQQVLEKVTEIF